MEGVSENDKLTPVYIAETLTFMTPPEYYARHLGGFCIGETNSDTPTPQPIPPNSTNTSFRDGEPTLPDY